jgi:hypothetical protein
MSRFDVARLSRIVSERLTQFLYARSEGVIAHDDVAPHGGEEIPLAHGMTCAFDEQAQHLGRLAGQLDLDLLRPQPTGRRLEGIAAEADPATNGVRHGAPPRVRIRCHSTILLNIVNIPPGHNEGCDR